MNHILQVIVLILGFISYQHQAIAQSELPYNSFFLPLNKHTDAAKPLYSAQIMRTNTNYLIDINAPFSWFGCWPTWNMQPGNYCPGICTPAVSCYENICNKVRISSSSKSPSCPPAQDSDYEGECYCPYNVVDSLDGRCVISYLSNDTFDVKTSNGRNPLPPIYSANANVGCVDPSTAFQSYPKDVTGVMALSTSPYALPASLNQPPLNKTLSLCLPSSTAAHGILFYGNGPYYLSDVDVRGLLSYTPLLKRPDSFGYFIGVNSFVIKKRSVDLPGNTTAKLSTTEPYTTLRTDIYNPMVRRFSLVTKRIPKANPIAPFSLCYSTSTNGTQAALKVPDIDINLQDGKKWTISTANSIKQITEDVACLAFVDGGAKSEHAIVIGTHQFEDNFLLFDLENSTFGFSSSLLRKQTSCANFDFTMHD
ncbi:aspartic peptidase A1 family [Artemisia annua]|uniref:Aspartic peptidase A1 family n=1 Tax=Artemisia annua TaxID=35608 RepID=A0A2U1LE62_ARTAN|nr:aspartic peptidase A1 family [Artemisia annua]